PNERQRLRLDEGPAPHPRIEAVINGHPVQAFLDLGCSAALLVSPALASDLRLTEGRPVSTRQVILSGNQGLGLGVSRLTSIDRLVFAGHTFADTPIDILPENARPFAGLDAIVGIP